MKQLRADIQKDAEKIGIKMAVLFGSQASGAATDGSDYDIAVLITPGQALFGSDLKQYGKIIEFLSKELDISDEKLDISGINEANPLLRYGIFSNGIMLFGDVDEFDEQRARAFREYIDAQPLFDLERMLNKKRNEQLSKQFA